MSAAIAAAEKKEKVVLLEKSDVLGRKLHASGNGRCNLMNTGLPVYYGDPGFASEVLDQVPSSSISAFFHHYGLVMTETPDGRVYPYSLQSATVLSTLKMALKLNHVEVVLNSRVSEIRRNQTGFDVFCSDSVLFSAARVIVCCGGAAQPRLGGTCDGYTLLQHLGHSVISPYPALSPVVTDLKSISGLSGIRISSSVSLYDRTVLLHQTSGELLFTDYGISGICVMQLARFLHNSLHQLHFEIDYLSRAFPNETAIFEDMKRRRDLLAFFSPVSLLEGILPSRISYAVLKQAGIPLKGEKLESVSDSDLEKIVFTATHYRIEAVEARGMEYAQVTAGGISCDQFDPRTLQSRLVPGLFATGEVLNVDGDCGGFNLMFAFASGLIAGRSGMGDEKP